MKSTADRALIAARSAYGRLLALLASRSNDIALAEDALADAFEAALRHWPVSGVPTNPQAWLLTTARNKLADVWKSAAHQTRDAFDEKTIEAMFTTELDDDQIPDERLKLLFVCAHPAIDESLHAPLMMQTVLGLEAAEVARAFVVAPSAMAQRLVRAKKKIKDAGIPFSIPVRSDMPERLAPVLSAVYGTYAVRWDHDDPVEPHEGLAEESIFLAHLLARLVPEHPETLALAALLSFSHSRRNARRNTLAAFVPLEEQDVGSWDKPMIDRAETLLSRAYQAQTKFGFAAMGRYQIEAAIQSVYCAKLRTGSIDWHALVMLYEALMQKAPSIGAAVARAAAVAKTQGPQAGLNALNSVEHETLANYQPAWATRAYLLAQLGQREAADSAYDRAIALCTEEATRRFLRAKQSA